jgi:hypothetical protein
MLLTEPFTKVLINIIDWSVFGALAYHEIKNGELDIDEFLAPRNREMGVQLQPVEEVDPESQKLDMLLQVATEWAPQASDIVTLESDPDSGAEPEGTQDRPGLPVEDKGAPGEQVTPPVTPTLPKPMDVDDSAADKDKSNVSSWAVINKYDNDGNVLAFTELADLAVEYAAYKSNERQIFVVRPKSVKGLSSMKSYQGDMLMDVVQILNVYSIKPITAHRFGAPTKTSVDRVRQGIMSGPKSTNTSKMMLPDALIALRQELGRRVAGEENDTKADRGAMIAMLHSLYLGLVHSFEGTEFTEATSMAELQQLYNLDFDELTMPVDAAKLVLADKSRYNKGDYGDDTVLGKKRNAEAAEMKKIDFFIRKSFN